MVREVYALGAGQMIVRLADFLDRAMARGQLRHAEPVFAAELLIAMILGQERTQLLFGVHRPPQDEAVKVDAVIDGFLRMFAPVSPQPTT